MTSPAPPLLLVAEEDPAVRGLITTILTGAGFAVTPVADGDAALALLTARRFDGAVLDGRMPGLSGPQVLARVRPELPDLPVVVISGGDGSVARTDPCTRFLSKPFGPGELVRTMAELVQE